MKAPGAWPLGEVEGGRAGLGWGQGGEGGVEGRGSREAGGGPGSLVTQKGSSPPRLYLSRDIKGTSPPTSPPGFFFVARWILPHPNPPLPRTFPQGPLPRPPPHAPQLSLGSAPPQPSSFLLSCWSPSFGIHSSLSSTTPDTASPSCPYLPPPVLFFWKKRSRGTLPLVPLKTLPCDLPFRCPRAPPQSLDFPN